MGYLIWQHPDGRIEPTRTSGTAPQVVFNATPTQALAFESWPGYIKAISRRRKPEDIGAGDTVAREIGEFGSSEFKCWFDEQTGFKSAPCRCKKELWNRQYSYASLPASGAITPP